MKTHSDKRKFPLKQAAKLPSERQVVERLQRKAFRTCTRNSANFRLVQGIGDDCAVISNRRAEAAGSAAGQSSDLLVTTDLLLDGIHFLRKWQPAASVGHKVLARGISDIAAMGGVPRFAFLSLGLPRGIEPRWVDEFFRGFFRLAEKTCVALAGGDTGASRSGVVADIMVMGEVPRGTAVLRSGARPGDSIWVSGKLGGAARALALLRAQSRASSGISRGQSRALQPLFYPQPRVELGQRLRESGLASAMMDLSDGLSIDLARLCKASGVGARVDAEAVPRFSGATLEMALHGGEDFELLFTIPGGKSKNVPRQLGGLPLTRIGEITKRKELLLVKGNRERPLPIHGFEHF